MQDAIGRPIPVTQDDDDRAEYECALSNLIDPIKSLELPAQQLGGTGWGDEIERIRGRLALICFEVRADLDEAAYQARERERRAS